MGKWQMKYQATFLSPAGFYTQQWTLSTTPILPDWQPISVTARGLCLPRDATGVERAALEKDMAEKEKMAKVGYK